MSRRYRILLLVFYIGIISDSYGAQPRITKSSLSTQLQQPTVSAIYRDTEGILWVGTQQGLHRFDGATLSVFNSDRSNNNWIPESEIKDIAEDNDGNILVATSGGILLKWNPHASTFDAINIFSLIDKKGLIRLLVSKNGSIWLLSKDGLLLFNARFQNTEEWIMNSKLLNKIGRLNDIVEDESGNLWVGGSLGLSKIQPQNNSITSFDLKTLRLPINARLTALQMNSEGNLIVGTDIGQLVVWDVNSSKSLVNTAIAGNSTKEPLIKPRFLAHDHHISSC